MLACTGAAVLGFAAGAAVAAVLARRAVAGERSELLARISALEEAVQETRLTGTVTGLVAGDALELVEGGEFAALSPIAIHFTALSAYSFLVFNLLCAPCFAAIGAIKREMNNAKWTWFAIGYQTLFAYSMSLMVYQFGLLLTGGGFGVGTAAAFAVLAVFLWLLLRKAPSNTAQGLRAASAAV